MRRDKNGHAWKWRGCTGYAFCSFCGIERAQSASLLPKGMREGFRRIGGGKWQREAPKCTAALDLGSRIAVGGRYLRIERIAPAWPPRFECYDTAGRKVVVPALSYWRKRNAGDIAPVVTCRRPTGEPPMRGTFNFYAAGWRVYGAPCAVRTSNLFVAPVHDAPPFMPQLVEMLPAMAPRKPRASGDRVHLGRREIDKVYHDRVMKAWPATTWLVHKEPTAPVVAVIGKQIVGVVAPISEDT